MLGPSVVAARECDTEPALEGHSLCGQEQPGALLSPAGCVLGVLSPMGAEAAQSHHSSVPHSSPGDDSMRTSQLNVGTSTDVSLKITESDLSLLTASIRAPSGNEEPCLLKRLPNRHIGELGSPGASQGERRP